MIKNKKLKVVVTGGAGFIGSNLVNALIDLDYEVVVIDNLISGKKSRVNKRAKLYVKDIVSYKDIKPIFKQADYVFHLAALPRVQDSIDKPLETSLVNFQGTLNVLQAASQARVNKLIFSSSSAVYGDQEQTKLSEKLHIKPLSPYALQKHLSELSCRYWSLNYNLPTVCLRYFNVYGPGQSHKGAYALVIAKFLKQFSLNQPLTITGDGNQTRDFVNVHDVVMANLKAMTSFKVGRGEVINIGSGQSLSVNQIAQLIGGRIKYIPARHEPRNSQANILLAKKLLNWQPGINIIDGLSQLKKYYENNKKATSD